MSCSVEKRFLLPNEQNWEKMFKVIVSLRNIFLLIHAMRVFIISSISASRDGGELCVSVRLARGRLGVRIPAATDISSLNRWWQFHCYTLSNSCECHRSSEMTIINGWVKNSPCGTKKNPHKHSQSEKKRKFTQLNSEEVYTHIHVVYCYM